MASLINIIKKDVTETEKYKDLSVTDILTAHFEKLNADIDKYADASVLTKHVESGAIDASRVFSAEQAEENRKHLHNYINHLFSYLLAESRMPEFDKVQIITTKEHFTANNEYVQPELKTTDCNVGMLLYCDSSEASKKYNSRITKLWNSGNVEDKRVVMGELFQQVENIDLDKWSRSSITYIMDNYSEFVHEMMLAEQAYTIFTEASDLPQLVPADTDYKEKLKAISERATLIRTRTDNALAVSVSPFGALIDNTGLDRVHIYGHEKPDPVSPFDNAEEYQEYSIKRRIKENSAKFIALCGENGVKVPGKVIEMDKLKSNGELKFVPEDIYEDFHEALGRKKEGHLPWEGKEYVEFEKLLKEKPEIAEESEKFLAARDYAVYRRALKQKKGHDAFVERCEKNSIPVPASLKELTARLNTDFKDFPPADRFSFFDAIREKGKRGRFPWESDVCIKGAAAEKKYPDIDAYTDKFEEYYYDLNGLKKSQEINRIYDTDPSIENTKNYYKSLGFALGYRAEEDFGFIIGGEGDNKLLTGDEGLKAMTTLRNKRDVSFAFDRNTGKVMAVSIDLVQIGGVVAREATAEQLAELEKSQYVSVKNAVDDFRNSINAMSSDDADMRALKDKLNKFDRLCVEIDNASIGEYKLEFNDCIAELGLAAAAVKKSCMRRAENNLLYEPEARAVMLCNRITAFAKERCVGVPEMTYEGMRAMVKSETETKKCVNKDGVKTKLDSIFNLLRNTCRGLRKDSDEFNQMMDSVKTTISNIETVKDNPDFTDDVLKEELRAIFTTAKEYLNYRKGKPVENSRTLTRLEAAQQIIDISKELDVKSYTPTEMLASRLCNDRIKSFTEKSDKAALIIGRKTRSANLLNDIEFNHALRGYSAKDIRDIPKFSDKLRGFIDKLRHLKASAEKVNAPEADKNRSL